MTDSTTPVFKVPAPPGLGFNITKNGYLGIGAIPSTLYNHQIVSVASVTTGPNAAATIKENISHHFQTRYLLQTLPGANVNFYGTKSEYILPPEAAAIQGSDKMSALVSSFTDRVTLQYPVIRALDNYILIDPGGTLVGGIEATGFATSILQASGNLINDVFGIKSEIIGANVTTATGWFNAYGLYTDISAGAGFSPQASYGLYINSIKGSPRAYGVYVLANVKNYFAGSVGIGVDTPSVKLEVSNSSIAITGAGAGLYISSTAMNLALPFFSAGNGTTSIRGAIDLDTVTVRTRLDIINTSNFVSSYTLRVGTGSTGVNTYHVAVTTNGAFSLAGGSPTVSSCGSTPNGALVRGNNQVGEISVGGTLANSCLLTFAPPFNFTPVCTVTDNNAAIAVAINSISNTAVTFGFGASLVGGRVYYHCLGNNE